MNPLQARLITPSHSAHDVPMCVREARGWLNFTTGQLGQLP